MTVTASRTLDSRAPLLLQSVPQLDRLRDEWDALAAAARTPLLEHDWFSCCARTLHAEADLRIVTVRSGGAMVAAAPLAVHRTPTGRRLVSLGAMALHEPGGLLFADESALRELVREMTAEGLPVAVPRVPSNSVLCRRLSALSFGRAIALARETRPSLAVPTSGSWDAYWKSLSRRITQNLPRLQAKAARAFGGVDVCALEPDSEEVPDLFELLMRVEASGWKGRRGSSLLQRSDLREFFRQYSLLAARRKRLRVMLLKFGADVAAVEFSIQAYDRIWQLKIAFEDRFAAYYPGIQLVRASIQAAFEQRVEAYEFLGSAASWEERWLPRRRHYKLVVLYPFSLRGFAGACRDAGSRLWRFLPKASLRTAQVA